jgi:hypothetical protein
MTRYGPLWQQAGTYTATLDRSLIGTVWPTGGTTGGAVTAVNNTMTVSVAPGTVIVPLATGQGAALCRWDAAEVVGPLAAAPASNSRIDLIVCQVRDNQLDAGSNNDFVFTFVTGTAAASPTPPATPANAYSMAQITVASGMTNLNTATINTVASGLASGAAYLDVSSTAPPPAAPTITPPEGLLWLDTSTPTPSAVAYSPPTAPPATGFNTFTDEAGEVWVSNNGSVWKRAIQALFVRLQRGAVYTFPTAFTNFPWDGFDDPYGVWARTSQQMTIPVAGLWLFAGSNYAPFTNLTTGPQSIQTNLVKNGTPVSRGTMETNWANVGTRCTLTDVQRCAVGDIILYQAICTLAGVSTTFADASNNFLAIKYLGTG